MMRLTYGMRLATIMLVTAGLLRTAAAMAQEPCGEVSFVHNYFVHEADAYRPLFETVEGYRAGPVGRAAWPFASDDSATYRTLDFCPADPDQRLVRLFELPEGASRPDDAAPGTLTLITKDLAASEEAAGAIAAEAPRVSTFRDRKSIYVRDGQGNEFMIWGHPGPPGRQ